MKGEHEQSELLHFLEAENKILREENKEFKELNQLNREALRIALSPGSKETQLPQLVRLLFEENSKLLLRCKTLREQLDQKRCQVLISEQIASASDEHQKYVAAELKQRLKILKKEIDSKHNKIEELTKALGKNDGGCPNNEETHTIVIQYTQISKVSEKLFKESQSLRREIDMKIQEIERLKEQKEDLIKLNLILTKQVNQMKAFSCQTTSSLKRDINTSSSDLSKFLKYQAKIAQNSEDQSEGPIDSDSQEDNSESDEDYGNPHEEEIQEMPVEKSLPIKHSVNLSLNLKKDQMKNEKPNRVIPKLQLKKAREIQSLIIKKINNDEKKKAGHQAKDQKSKKYEIEADQLKKRLGSQVMLKLKVEKENSFLKKFISELQNRNSLLVKEKKEKCLENDYEKERLMYQEQNMETLLDICRDVTLNERLKAVCKGNQRLNKKDHYSKEI